MFYSKCSGKNYSGKYVSLPVSVPTCNISTAICSNKETKTFIFAMPWLNGKLIYRLLED